METGSKAARMAPRTHKDIKYHYRKLNGYKESPFKEPLIDSLWSTDSHKEREASDV
jgi:hypothetical protein